MNDTLLAHALRNGSWLERLAWILMQLTGTSILVAGTKAKPAS